MGVLYRMSDIFEKYSTYYDMPISQIPRPQPSDFVIKYFEDKKSLFFVDIGAYDGITWSNSLPLEENYNWSGLCIEANPLAYQKLFKVRKSKNFNYAISNNDEEEMIYWAISGYCEMLSGFEKFYDKKHIERINKEIEEFGGNVTKIKILSKTLQSILEKEKINKIDYLSIDTEGSELSVLQGINFDLTDITLISCENNEYNQDVEYFLTNNRYKKIVKICGDDFYERKK